MGRADVAKAINPSQLLSEIAVQASVRFIGGDSPSAIECDSLTDAQLAAFVDAHVADSDWRTPGAEKDWRTKLQAEIDFLTTQAVSFPANPNAAQTSAAIKRLARDQVRVLKFIRDNTFDSGNV